MKLWINDRKNAAYSDDSRRLISVAHADTVLAFLDACPAHRPTPLHSLDDLARDLGLAAVQIKDESHRMGLGSFKALGGAYAVFALARDMAEAALGRRPAPVELTSDEVKASVSDLVVACATAGNHGMSVAAAARQLGCRAVVYISHTVPVDFETRLAAIGAEVVRNGDDYEASLDAVRRECNAQGWRLIADTAQEGYTEVPLTIMRGYLAMAAEAADQCEQRGGPPTHIFLQAAVGGLAGSIGGYFLDRYQDAPPRVIVVEPEGAPCLLESARAGRMLTIEGGPTVLGRLDCKEPSLLGLQLLSANAFAFTTIIDEEAFEAMRVADGCGLEIGESGAAGLGALLSAAVDADQRPALGLDQESRVLLVASEGPADLALFERVTGHPPAGD
jgi:diaminopropionate ammonia-lyase